VRARAAVAASGINGLTQFYETFRCYGLEAAEDNVVSAGVSVGTAAIDVVIFTAQTVVALAGIGETAGAATALLAVPFVATGLATAISTQLSLIQLGEAIIGKAALKSSSKKRKH
jgi:hypothetical protein